MTCPDFKNIAIIGMGLMGGSLGMALCGNFSQCRVTGVVRRENAIEGVLTHHAAHHCTTDLQEGLHDADLVILAIPVEKICDFAPKIAPFLKSGAIVTDMGSTKEKIVNSMDAILDDNAHFVGAHPMCGSEMTSIDHAFDTLYNDALCIVTPDKNTNFNASSKVELFWKSVGCRVTIMSPSEHDKLVAAVSHIPHLVASGLVNTAAQTRSEHSSSLDLASSGFIDTTRIASGSPEMWQDICTSNKKYIIDVLKHFEDIMRNLRIYIENQNIDEILTFLKTAKDARDNIISSKKGSEL